MKVNASPCAPAIPLLGIYGEKGQQRPTQTLTRIFIAAYTQWPKRESSPGVHQKVTRLTNCGVATQRTSEQEKGSKRTTDTGNTADEQKKADRTHAVLVHLYKFLVQAKLSYSDKKQICDCLGWGMIGGTRTQGASWEGLVS